MFYEQFIKQFVGYATYHQDERNELTHFFGVPPIFISTIFLFSAELFRFGDAALLGVPLSLGLCIFLVLAASWIALDAILGGIVLIIMLPVLVFAPGWADWVQGATAMGTWGVVLAFLVVQVLAWAIQLWGHVYEGRRPRILENFFQSTLAMMFLVQIILTKLGLRKKLQARVDQEIDAWNKAQAMANVCAKEQDRIKE